MGRHGYEKPPDAKPNPPLHHMAIKLSMFVLLAHIGLWALGLPIDVLVVPYLCSMGILALGMLVLIWFEDGDE